MKACYALADAWQARTSNNFIPHKNDIEGWSAQQSYVFLERVMTFKHPVSSEDVVLMGEKYG